MDDRADKRGHDERGAPGERVERVEQVGQRIERARAVADEWLGGPQSTFVESGDERSAAQADQTIAPPG